MWLEAVSHIKTKSSLAFSGWPPNARRCAAVGKTKRTRKRKEKFHNIITYLSFLPLRYPMVSIWFAATLKRSAFCSEYVSTMAKRYSLHSYIFVRFCSYSSIYNVAIICFAFKILETVLKRAIDFNGTKWSLFRWYRAHTIKGKEKWRYMLGKIASNYKTCAISRANKTYCTFVWSFDELFRCLALSSAQRESRSEKSLKVTF